MQPLNALTLLLNGLTLALASGVLLIVLWQDSRKSLIQFFAIFLVMVLFWNIGSLLVQMNLVTPDNPTLSNLSISILELGFTGSSVAIYILTTTIIGVLSQRFRFLALASLSIVFAYRVFLILTESTTTNPQLDTLLDYQFQPLFIVFYLVFDTITLFLLWYYRRKVRSGGLIAGIGLFLLGQTFVFVNPELIIASFATSVSSFGAMVISFAIIQQEIILPLSERNSQIEALHRVSLAISSRIAIDTVLDEIVVQAVDWLNADAVGILLAGGDRESGERALKLITQYSLPSQYVGIKVPFGYGITGTTAEERRTIFVENYGRDWHGVDEFPLSRETFGSLIAVPLMYAENIIGVLLVVAGRHGRLFNLQDVHLLELLSAQAAVAIAHSQLFANQQQLTKQIDVARTQLETVLTSTDNPVLAVNRNLHLIFANPAARRLFEFEPAGPIYDYLPREVFPDDFRDMVRSVRQRGGYVYEMTVADRDYLCHLAALGERRIEGWVAVLNDVTQLKELDRMRSEMMRMASHDLKNPLMGAMTNLDLLRDDLRDAGYVEAEKTLNTIDWQLERMNRIIRGVLDIERLRITMESSSQNIDAREVVQHAIQELMHFIQAARVDILVDIEDGLPPFRGDREQFERALVNVIENAAKFTLDAGQVTVAVHRKNGELVFAVQDNGVGIPADMQPHVFERFYRGQQRGVEHITGSGLGLSLVKTIVEKHNGRVWLESEETVGTTVYMAVPFAGS